MLLVNHIILVRCEHASNHGLWRQ